MISDVQAPDFYQAFREAQSKKSCFKQEDIAQFQALLKQQYALSAKKPKNTDDPLSSSDKKSYWDERAEKHKQFMELAQEQWLKEKKLQVLFERKALTKPEEGKAVYLAGIFASELLSIL